MSAAAGAAAASAGRSVRAAATSASTSASDAGLGLGTTRTFWHFRHLAFLPARVAGAETWFLQWGHAKRMNMLGPHANRGGGLPGAAAPRWTARGACLL